MLIELPYLAAFAFLFLFAVAYNHFDHKWLSDRIDDVEYNGDLHRDATDKRIELAEGRVDGAEDWIRHLDLLTRGQAGAPTEPFPVIDPSDPPPTEPQSLVLIREWSKDVAGPVESWPREQEDEPHTEVREVGGHRFRVRVDEA